MVLTIAVVYWSKGWWRWLWQPNYWSYKSYKAPVKSSPPTHRDAVFLHAGCPSFRPTKQCQSTEGNNITFHGLAYPELTWGHPTLSLTTNGSCLPWGRVTVPLISLLMPVPRPWWWCWSLFWNSWPELRFSASKGKSCWSKFMSKYCWQDFIITSVTKTFVLNRDKSRM